MGIYYDEQHRTFHLQTCDTSYVMGIVKENYLAHYYWGKKIRAVRMSRDFRYKDRGFSPNPNKNERSFSLDTLPQEYPSYGHTDFRHPAIHVELSDGTRITDFRYEDHEISVGKPKLHGLPATYAEENDQVHTLQVYLKDDKSGLLVVLTYSVFENLNAITRSVKVRNNGNEAHRLLKVASMSMDMRDKNGFEMINLAGSHEQERNVERLPMRKGMQSIESRRGASSHQQNPFVALVHPKTTENENEAYGFSFVYSGNFEASLEIDQTEQTRVTMGINSFDFSWYLEPEEVFQSPEVVLVYSDHGIGGMSRIFHNLYQKRLCRGKYRDKERPVLINNWEATYFDFDENSILTIADQARQLGIELFVLDDGWFGQRNDDKTSLGDWVPDKNKLPGGLPRLADRVKSKGLQFGIWLEPEMVSPDSDLYREHPDWCLHVPGQRRSESRNQLVLDLSREDVCNEIIERISDVFNSASIDYVKWDMNRNMTEIGSSLLPSYRQQETAHRYVLGLYSILETLTARFPDILFESCAGGGGRFDPGMLYYMPQTWTSDNTDAISRLRIHHGTSLVYPASTMAAHVSDVPNHQTGRVTSLQTRGHVAMDGNLGYELDITKLDSFQKKEIKHQVEWYKSVRHIIQFGHTYRLANPLTSENYAVAHVSEDKTEAVLLHVHVLTQGNTAFNSVRLQGLDPNYDYRVTGNAEKKVYGGDELMYAGLNLPYPDSDFFSSIFRLKAL